MTVATGRRAPERPTGATRARVGQLIRYGTVSLVATATSLVVLGVLVSTRTMTAGWANVVATGVGTVPSFELNRRWVWRKAGKRSVAAEVGPFAALSFAGLGLSTLAVTVAGRWADHSGLDGVTRTLAVESANLIAFGTLWIAQFLVLDLVLFGRDRRGGRLDGSSQPVHSHLQGWEPNLDTYRHHPHVPPRRSP